MGEYRTKRILLVSVQGERVTSCRRIKYKTEIGREISTERGSWPGWAETKKPDADGVFEYALYVKFNDDDLKFDYNDADNANDNYGSASGFLPKCL